MTTPDDLVSISEAARRLEIRRAMIERWIADGKLGATRSETDRRIRHIRYSEAEALLKQVSLPESVTRMPPHESHIEDTYLEQIDQALQLIYSHFHRLTMRLFPAAFKPLTIEQLRAGPLGQDLVFIARVARGADVQHRETVLNAIEGLIQLLFWPAGADDYSVPRAFWDTDLGRMLALAKYRSFQGQDLISIAEAATRLGVNRPTVYRWLDDRTLNYVRDDAKGRTLVVAKDVEALLAMARSFDRQEHG